MKRWTRKENDMSGYIGGHYKGITTEELVNIIKANGNVIVVSAKIELATGIVIELPLKEKGGEA